MCLFYSHFKHIYYTHIVRRFAPWLLSRRGLILMNHLLWVVISWHSEHWNNNQIISLKRKGRRRCCRCVPVLYLGILLLCLLHCFLQPTCDLLVWEIEPVTLQWGTRHSLIIKWRSTNKKLFQTLWRLPGRGETLTMSLALGWIENNNRIIILKAAGRLLSCLFFQSTKVCLVNKSDVS